MLCFAVEKAKRERQASSELAQKLRTDGGRNLSLVAALILTDSRFVLFRKKKEKEAQMREEAERARAEKEGEWNDSQDPTHLEAMFIKR